MLNSATKTTSVNRCFTPCKRGDSLLQNFRGAASGAANRDAFGFHPSVQASNNFETVKFRVVSFGLE